MLNNFVLLAVDDLLEKGVQIWAKSHILVDKLWADISTTTGYTQSLHSLSAGFYTALLPRLPSVNYYFYTLYPALINKTVY